MTPHPVMPIAALELGAAEYMRKFEQLSKAKTELRENLSRMDQCSEEFWSSIEGGIAYLQQYRDWWLQWMQSEKEHAKTSIEAGIQEADSNLAKGSSPVNPIAKAIWTLPTEQLRLFTYTVAVPDLHALAQGWVTCSNGISTVADRLDKKPSPAVPKSTEEKKTAPAVPKTAPQPKTKDTPLPKPIQRPRQSALSDRLLFVERNQVKLFDFSQNDWDTIPLSSVAATDRGTQYVWAEEDLVCCGGRE